MSFINFICGGDLRGDFAVNYIHFSCFYSSGSSIPRFIKPSKEVPTEMIMTSHVGILKAQFSSSAGFTVFMNFN